MELDRPLRHPRFGEPTKVGATSTTFGILRCLVDLRRVPPLPNHQIAPEVVAVDQILLKRLPLRLCILCPLPRHR